MNDAVGAVVLGARASDVDTVLVAGRVVKRRGKLIGVDLPRLLDRLRSSRDYLLGAAGEAPLRRTESGGVATGERVLVPAL